MNTPLSDAEITAALREMEGWSHQRDALEREYRFSDFRAALAFMFAEST